MDELCEPIGAHLAWRHPKTKESVWPKTDDDDDKDNAAARVVSWRTASSTTPWRTVVPLESFSAPFMTRDARFDSSLMFMAKDMPTDLHDACASAPLELRIHDRVVRAVPEKFPGLDKLEGKDDGSGEGAEGAEGAEGGGTNAKGSFDADGFPVAAAYAKAVFDLRSACEWPRTRTKFHVEANLEPVSAVPGGAGASLDWTCRAGRYVEAHATVTMTFETCAPLRDPRAPPPTPAKTIDVDAEEGAEAPAAEGEGAEGEGAEVPPTPPDPRPFRRCVFAMHYSNVPLFREILDVVRRRNAKTLGVDGTPAHVLFELAHARFEPAQIADPSFAVVTGFHVIDGVTRLILIEGTAGGDGPGVRNRVARGFKPGCSRPV